MTRKGQENIWLLYAVSIICGAVLMALEIAGGRLLSPFFGSSVYVWGSVISVFLIALTVGYYYGGIFSDKWPDLGILSVFIGLSGLLIFIIPYILAPIVNLSFALGFKNFGALFVAVAAFFPASAILGMVSPYVVKLGVLEANKVGKLVGKFYSVSTFGSIVGTLGTTFVLTPLFGVRKLIFAMGIILLVMTLVVFILRKRFTKAVVNGLLIIAIIALSITYTPQIALSKERGNLLFERETLYNNIAVVDGWDGLRYLLFNETEQSAMVQSEPDRNIWPYTYLMLKAADTYRPEAKKELLIGLGGGTLPKYTYSHEPKVDMDTVEIDPQVLSVAKEYFFLQDNDRIHNYVDDGRMFIKDKKDLYDVIYIDAYNRNGIPYHLTTKEFFQELSKAMKPNGIVVFNVVSGVEGETGKFFKSVLKTSEGVFKNRKLFFAEKRNSLEELNNLILVVSNGELKADKVENFQAYKGAIDVSNAIELTDDYAPVDSLAASIMMK